MIFTSYMLMQAGKTLIRVHGSAVAVNPPLKQTSSLPFSGDSPIRLFFFLGLIKTLNGLNINNNPLEFPPLSVVEKGTSEILKFLREMIQAKSSGKLLNGSK